MLFKNKMKNDFLYSAYHLHALCRRIASWKVDLKPEPYQETKQRTVPQCEHL